MGITYRELATGVHLVTPTGPLNHGPAECLIQTFGQLSAHGVRRVIIALEDVSFIDSHGLAALIAGFRLFGNEGGDFRLVGAQDQPKLLFELTGFDRIFQTSDSLTETSAAKASIPVLPVTRRQVPVPQLALAV
jgi:anti-anti-sigma factor